MFKDYCYITENEREYLLIIALLNEFDLKVERIAESARGLKTIYANGEINKLEFVNYLFNKKREEINKIIDNIKGALI